MIADAYNTILIDKETTVNIVYVIKENERGDWLVTKLDKTTGIIPVTYANITNNPTIKTSTDAIANLEDLTYDNWSDIF